MGTPLPQAATKVAGYDHICVHQIGPDQEGASGSTSRRSFRSSGSVRRLLIALAVLVVLLVGADIGARVIAERVVGRQIESSLHLSERPSVSLGGFPFLLHFAEGSFPSASARASRLQEQFVSFSSFVLTLRDLTFDPARVLSGSGESVRAGSGTGLATMTAAEANDALHSRGIDATVRFTDGRVVVRSPFLQREIPATLDVSGRLLVVRSTDPAIPRAFSLPLPQVLAGLRFTSVHVEGSALVFRFEVGAVSLRAR